VLLSATASFAQAWTVKVTWDASSANCECNASIGSKYAVNLRIIDVANGNTVVYNNSLFVDATETEKTFDVKADVKGHCDDPNINNIPNYTIYAYVGFWCAETTPPELICSGDNSKPNISCLDFSSQQQTTNVVLN
jgi:hypothetical protein